MKTLALAILLASPLSLSAAGKRPNFLIIVADDQATSDFGFYDPKSTLETPNLDRLAAEGTVLDAAYHMGSWSGAVCTPSRHMIMSGASVWHLPRKKRDGAGAKLAASLADNSLAAVFNRAGYDTMRTCKNGNSFAAANRKFQVVRDASKRDAPDPLGSGWHAQQVLDYLAQREVEKDPDPFLIYFGFSHPHDTRNGKDDLLAKYGASNHTDRSVLPKLGAKSPPLPPNYLPRHPFDSTHMGCRDEVNVSGVWDKRDPATVRNEIGREFACSENIDIQVGKVLAKLETMDQLENTIVIYTSDHGIAIGRHGLMGKQNLYEHTWRVPFIVKGPGIKAGHRAPGNAYLMDLLATCCDFAGIESPPTNEGTSLRPILEGKKETVRDTLYGVYCGGTKPGIRSVRSGDWKLVKYEDEKNGTVHTQLFDLASNPLELLPAHHDSAVSKLTGIKPDGVQTNLAAKPEFEAKRKELEELLLRQMKDHDDPYRFSDHTGS
ncbi:sulfatase [Haloferula helveola]|uniref:Sulfatase n=1 Tax=Haloferula helveola TaxID=490095 RepID=A0ABM7RCM9_9BACT|nr:sulfatase [Haloferula helveola]